MATIWKAPANVLDQMNEVRSQYHLPRLEEAKIAVAFADWKPYTKEGLQWGTVTKFSSSNKIWLEDDYNFCITLCAEVWHDILIGTEKKCALLDLHLGRCGVEYMPETVMEGKKKIVVKDEFGCTKYTNEIKRDDEGNPKWMVLNFNLHIASQNARRYGLWCPEYEEFGNACSNISN